MLTQMRPRQRHERKPGKGYLKIFTSVACCAYTAQLINISKSGAFVKTDHLPSPGDTITYQLLDDKLSTRLQGNARVIWCKKGERNERGFGMELDVELPDNILSSVSC